MPKRVRVYVLGADGQVGHELCGALGCFAEVIRITEADFDMTDSQRLRESIRAARPDVIVNAAAYTDVDGAERNPALARAINTEAVRVLGEESVAGGIGLVHYSTDFVFDGAKGTPYVETDAPRPLNEYGRSKLDGELALEALAAPAIVLRTAWVYSLRKKSFVSSILRLARERTELRIVSDQIGNPTFCRDLAVCTALILYGIRKDPLRGLQEGRGTYHLAGTGYVDRCTFAQRILSLDPRKHEQSVKAVTPVGSDEYPLPAKRPTNAPLDCTKFTDVFGAALPPWEEALERALAS